MKRRNAPIAQQSNHDPSRIPARPDRNIESQRRRPLGRTAPLHAGAHRLGRAGNSLPSAPLLAFELAHAQARDAVHQPLDTSALHQALHDAGFETLDASSAAPDRDHYLRRPDLGRTLDAQSAARLADHASTTTDAPDVVFVVADGLSAFAAARHAVPLLEAVRAKLTDTRIGPVVVARQARVALGDGIGALLRARIVVVLIGERPGLSSPDSLGIYLTYDPRIGRTDAQRNCISNVRPEGLSYTLAAHKLHYPADRGSAFVSYRYRVERPQRRVARRAEYGARLTMPSTMHLSMPCIALRLVRIVASGCIDFGRVI